MMLQNRVIKCNLENVSRVIFNWDSPSTRFYMYKINALQFSDREALMLKYNATSKSIDVFSSLSNFQSVNIPMLQYSRLMVVCQDVSKKGSIVLKYDSNLVYKFHFYNTNWNVPKVKQVFNVSRTDSLVTNKVPVNKRLASIAELQQNKLVLKKGKFRFKTKAFWTKRSDFSRSHWSRLSRYITIVDNRANLSMKRKYTLKHKMLNYLLWKLGMSLKDLQLFFIVSRSVSSNVINSFAYWVTNRLPHVLVSTGFCRHYFDANKLIASGSISVNSLPVLDNNYIVKAGDLINIINWPDEIEVVKFKDHLSPEHLLVDWDNYQILIKSNSLLLNNFIGDQYQKIDVGVYRQKVVGLSKDPLFALLWRFEPFIRKLSR